MLNPQLEKLLAIRSEGQVQLMTLIKSILHEWSTRHFLRHAKNILRLIVLLVLLARQTEPVQQPAIFFTQVNELQALLLDPANFAA